MEQKAWRKKYPVSAHDYILLEEVGQGVSSVVYRAKCIPFNEIVAVKILDLEKCDANLEEIRREAQIMRLVSHPNILIAYCSFVVEQSLWVVMPYMAGGSCLHIMKAAYPDGFEEHAIATMLRECLKALDYLHNHGHIHQDVKAGSIFVDSNGSVKLGDVGASACIFDRGERQRSRTSFVGTPCWMAPEVMEQLHIYDFKADIWSFGITALELAHGHAPFSKYPPMKVLLMTLQNTPPGLDYERDKRFTKAFKEMVAVCLVKDPSKRPTAEKLLKHAFFKRARSCDCIARNILDGLPPLGQRHRNLKLIDAERLAQKKMPFDEKEEKSQNEYKRGVSAWNFDVEDLKAQAALIHDDNELLASKEEDDEQPKSMSTSGGSDNLMENPSREPVLVLQTHFSTVADDFQSPVTIHSLRAESTTDAGEHVTKVRSGPLPAPGYQGTADELKESFSAEEGKEEGKWPKRFEERDLRVERLSREGRRSSSGPLLAEYVLSSCKIRDEDRDRSRPMARPNGIMSRIYASSRTFSGPLTLEGQSLENRLTDGLTRLSKHVSGNREGLEKGLYVQRGRFSVTSEDIELSEGRPQAPHRSASTQALSHLSHTHASASNVFHSAATVLPYLRNMLQHSVTQQELISSLIDNIKQVETSVANGSIHPGGELFSWTARIGAGSNLVKVSSEREQELLHQVADLQRRVVSLVEELQAAKLRNVALERQLTAIYNKELEDEHGRMGKTERNS